LEIKVHRIKDKNGFTAAFSFTDFQPIQPFWYFLSIVRPALMSYGGKPLILSAFNNLFLFLHCKSSAQGFKILPDK
jgi:hypothetical protein